MDLKVITCDRYTHQAKYALPVPPSPNLRTMEAVYAYPSICLFEGTNVSLGRGTDKPFRQYGCPEFEGKFTYSFTPQSMPGAKEPPLKDKKCYGELVAGTEKEVLRTIDGHLYLGWLIKAYNAYPQKEKFFIRYITQLAGNTQLEAMIKKGASEKEIRAQWAEGLEQFKKIRKKYLLYADFE